MMIRSTLRTALLTVALTIVTNGVRAEEPTKAIDAKQLDALWADLIQSDDEAFRQAPEKIRTLAGAAPLVVPYCKQRLKPVPAPDAKKVAQCLTDLDSNDFRTRERGSTGLEAIGYLAVPAVERKLTEKLPLESQRRLEMLLAKIDRHVLSAEELRTVRAIEVLTRIGSPEGVAILKDLSTGAEGAVETAHAKRALAIVAGRTASR
jgi:hypothetical protein